MRTGKCLSNLMRAAALTALFLSSAAAAPAVQADVSADVVLGDHYPQAKVAFPGGVTGLPAVTYAEMSGFRPLTLDIYLPPKRKAQGAPLVLYIHGGGWTNGHSRQSGAFSVWPDVLASLAARGYVVASLNYRLSSEAPFPAAEQDIKAAIKWLRAHAQQYGIDTGKTVVWGGSAGGHLAALTGVSCGVQALEPARSELQDQAYDVGKAPPESLRNAEAAQSDCVQGVVSWYGVFDFSALAKQRSAAPRPAATNTPNPLQKFLGCNPAQCPASIINLVSPASMVKPNDPPMLLIFGSNDKTVPPAQSKDFYKLLQANHVRSTLMEIPGVGHSFVGADAKSTREASLQALAATFAFIDSAVGGSK